MVKVHVRVMPSSEAVRDKEGMAQGFSVGEVRSAVQDERESATKC